MYFATDDVHVAARVRVLLRQFILQKLQMQHNGVDRILDFMSHTASHAAAGRNAAGQFDFISAPADPLSVAHDEESTDLSVLLMNKIERDLNPPSISGPKFALHERATTLKSVQYCSAQQGVAGEDLLHRMAE